MPRGCRFADERQKKQSAVPTDCFYFIGGYAHMYRERASVFGFVIHRGQHERYPLLQERFLIFFRQAVITDNRTQLG